MSGRLILASGQIEPHDPVGPDDAKRVHTLWSNIDAPLGCSRCHEEYLLGFDEIAKAIINAVELGHRHISRSRDAPSHLSPITPGRCRTITQSLLGAYAAAFFAK